MNITEVTQRYCIRGELEKLSQRGIEITNNNF